MASNRTVTVVVEALSHDVGHWCRSCALPSGIRQHVAIRTSTRMSFGTQTWCEECGSRDVQVDDHHPA